MNKELALNFKRAQMYYRKVHAVTRPLQKAGRTEMTPVQKFGSKESLTVMVQNMKKMREDIGKTNKRT